MFTKAHIRRTWKEKGGEMKNITVHIIRNGHLYECKMTEKEFEEYLRK